MEKVIIVSVHVRYFSYTPVYVRQVRLSGTPVYICLHQFTSVDRDVELDNRDMTGTRQGQDRDKTWGLQGKERDKNRNKTETSQ